jgi:hypothetical protein
VWESVRCPEPAKEVLLENFVRGRPASHVGPGSNAPGLATCERFYRLVRASCAKAEHLQGRIHAVPHDPSSAAHGRAGHTAFRADGAPGEIIIGLVARHGRVRVAPVPLPFQIRLCSEFHRDPRPGRLLLGGPGHAYALLPVWGDYVLVPEEQRHEPRLAAANALQDAWSDALRLLARNRRLALRHLHLHLGEVCYRINRRNEDLATSLRHLMDETDVRDVRPILAAGTGPVWRRALSLAPGFESSTFGSRA